MSPFHILVRDGEIRELESIIKSDYRYVCATIGCNLFFNSDFSDLPCPNCGSPLDLVVNMDYSGIDLVLHQKVDLLFDPPF